MLHCAQRIIKRDRSYTGVSQVIELFCKQIRRDGIRSWSRDRTSGQNVVIHDDWYEMILSIFANNEPQDAHHQEQKRN
jgi:hypothetical protein